MSTRSPARLASPAKVVLHAILLLVGWALLAYGWWLVAARPWDSYGLRLLIVGGLIVFPLLNGFWILHNVTRYRGRNQRHQVRHVESRYEHDWVGRSIAADWNLLANAREVRIDIDGGVKRYRDGAGGDGPARADGAPEHSARAVPAAAIQPETAKGAGR